MQETSNPGQHQHHNTQPLPHDHQMMQGLEKEMATHSSIFAWKNPWTEESGGLKSMGLHDWACMHEGGGRWVGSNKLVEQKKKKKVAILQKPNLKSQNIAI